MNLPTLLSLSVVALSLNAFAGDKGHGGGGHVCGDSVELYDFFEGRNPYLHEIPVWRVDPNLTMADYLAKAMAHLKSEDQGIGQYVESKLNEMLKIPYNQLVLPILIPRTSDADLPLVEENCEFQQVANWNERFGKVFFSRKYFEKMDAMSKAGLYVHEVLYKIARDSKVTMDSNDIRKLVAMIFSDQKIKVSEIERIVLPKGTVLFVPADGKCEVQLNFIQFGKERVYRVSANVPGKEEQALEHYEDVGGFFNRKIIVKDTPLTVNCQSILKNGLIVEYGISEPAGLMRIDVEINGKNVLSLQRNQGGLNGYDSVRRLQKESFYIESQRMFPVKY